MSRAERLINRLSRRMNATTIKTQRKTEGQDSGGAPTKSWADSLTDVKAHVQIMSGAEAVRHGRENNRLLGKVYVAAGLDITEEDRVVYNSRTFNITALREAGEFPSTDRLGHMILEVEETKP